MTLITRCLAVPALALGFASVHAAPTTADIDRLATRTLKEFSVPGIAIGVIKDGRVVLAKGYGVRETGGTAAVDASTLFAIGSNTKAFTTAALSILVDEGKIGWDDRVIDYLPDFRMWDPYVTREFRIRDLLTHRSGLGTGAGDLMFVTPTDFTRNDLLRALRYLKPASSFRTQFAYDNLLYVIAGQIIPAVTGQSWEDFVTARILKPLRMEGCAVDDTRLTDRSNIAAPHVIVDGKLTQIPPLSIPLVAPAGAINCNVTGMLKWVSTQLARGKSPDGVQLFSAARSAEMWTPQTILPTGSNDRLALTRTHFASYGLGWSLEDIDGYERVSHNGGLPGMVTHVSSHSRAQPRCRGPDEPTAGGSSRSRLDADHRSLHQRTQARLGSHIQSQPGEARTAYERSGYRPRPCANLEADRSERLRRHLQGSLARRSNHRSARRFVEPDFRPHPRAVRPHGACRFEPVYCSLEGSLAECGRVRAFLNRLFGQGVRIHHAGGVGRDRFQLRLPGPGIRQIALSG